MYNHAPKNYICPLCLTINGIESPDTMMKQADIFYRDNLVMAAINSKFVGNNPGHVIIVPLKHYENIYDLPTAGANQIMKIAKELALALKTVRKCDGVMLQQNNEPASGQHAFHYHLHLFPRFNGDELSKYMAEVRVSEPEERTPYASALREHLILWQKN